MKKVRTHNKAYYANDVAIKKVYVDILKKEHRMASQREVSEILGLSTNTLSTHMRAFDLSQIVNPFKIFGSDVLVGLQERAEGGDAAAARLFFMLVFDWSEKHEIKAKVDATVKAKVKGDVKVNVSPRIAKAIGDLLAEEGSKENSKRGAKK